MEQENKQRLFNYFHELTDGKVLLMEDDYMFIENTFQPNKISDINNQWISVEEIKNRIAAFSDKTFGADRPYTAPLHHLKKEVDETINDGDIIEFADCLLLLLDAFRKRHPDVHTDQLFKVCDAKIKICEERQWGKPDANGVIEHIRTNPSN